jgi:hypothetical protein
LGQAVSFWCLRPRPTRINLRELINGNTNNGEGRGKKNTNNGWKQMKKKKLENTIEVKQALCAYVPMYLCV